MSQPANDNATTHGAYSRDRVDPGLRRLETRVKRRELAARGLRVSELDKRARVLLQDYVHIKARVEAIEEFTERQGLLDQIGEPLPVLKLYIALLNAGARAQARFDDYLQATSEEPDPFAHYRRARP